MKHIAIVLSFAAALAAQTGSAGGQGAAGAQDALAVAIAVEEQERDLAKAESLYRAAMVDAKLSADAQQQARLRLVQMLQRLGRVEEASQLAKKSDVVGNSEQDPAPQDAAREEALREKARVLVKRVLEDTNPDQALQESDTPLYLLHKEVAEQLLWIGAPAVPVVIAGIEELTKGGFDPRRVSGLAGFLWRVGGPQAEAFVRKTAQHGSGPFRVAMARTAFMATRPDMLNVAKVFLHDTENEVFDSVLWNARSPNDPALIGRLDLGEVVDAVAAGNAHRQARLLGWASRIVPGSALLLPDSLGKLVKVAAAGLQSTDPELGTVALRFVMSSTAQRSIDDLEILLHRLPLAGRSPDSRQVRSPYAPPLGARPDPRQPRPSAVAGIDASSFTKVEAERLLPQVTECASQMPFAEDSGACQWLEMLMNDVAQPIGNDCMPHMLRWLRAGYCGPDWLKDRVTVANCEEVWAACGRLARHRLQTALTALAQVDLPEALFPALVQREESTPPADELQGNFALAMAHTGNPEAADWLMSHCAKATYLGNALLALGQRTQDERVRSAMRKVATAYVGYPIPGEELILALLAMHDAGGLDLAVENAALHAATLTKPFRYLIEGNPNPPHGFSEDEVIAAMRKVAAKCNPGVVWFPTLFTVDLVPDRVVGEMASLCIVDSRNEWVRCLLSRIETRRATHTSAAIEDWVRQTLDSTRSQSGLVRDVLDTMDKDLVLLLRPSIEKLLEADSSVAMNALAALRRVDIVSGVEWTKRLLANPFSTVRMEGIGMAMEMPDGTGKALVLGMAKDADTGVREMVAKTFGAALWTDAVPQLIEMLRDPEELVRTAAADSLLRIRFYHEQQAHWDRVLKGLDASSTSAAEKLLLQAKPTTPRAQRLLAITSLGTLGVPEALPFLIDWTSDADAEIAAAAKASITQIQLNPRR